MSSLAPDRMTVFQKCLSEFNRPSITAQEARDLLTKLIHLFLLGESFGEAEATQLFFTITRLFQKESAGLKQIIYLAIKELAPLTDNVIMGTSVLIKDIQQSQSQGSGYKQQGSSLSGENESYQSQALRTLCRILDAGAVEGMDRIIRPAFLNKHKGMSAAALVSAYHLLPSAPEAVKRWAPEAQEILFERHGFDQYLALGFLSEVRAHDSRALRKLVVSLAENLSSLSSESNYLKVLHARLAGKLLMRAGKVDGDLCGVLQAYMRVTSGSASLEAAKNVLMAFPHPENNAHDQAFGLVRRALAVLADQLNSPSAPARLGAVRALNKYSENNADLVGAACNEELENLVSDPNKAVASYAVAVLLKTGSEASVDGLVARISRMLGDFSDDFRMVAVDAVRSFARRFPSKRDAMLEFFSQTLEHPGSAELKIQTVESIGDLLRSGDASSEALNNALLMLCETIEDSEYPQVTVRVLHLLGEAGPTAPAPATYVRFIQNRIILENSVVRAAAVSALAKFKDVPGASSLVNNAALDTNDEVRDRASVAKVSEISTLPKSKFDINELQQRLTEYLSSGNFGSTFATDGIPLVSDSERVVVKERVLAPEPEQEKVEEVNAKAEANLFEESYAEASKHIKTQLGKKINSGEVQNLTEDAFDNAGELEYLVKAVVHVYEKHIVLQFEVNNNYQSVLRNLRVVCEPDEELQEIIEPVEEVLIDELNPQETKSFLSVYERSGIAVGTLSAEMQYTDETGDEDEYALREFNIYPSEFVKPNGVSESHFNEKWDSMEIEESATSALEVQSVLAASTFIKTRCGLTMLSDRPDSEAQKATLLYSGLCLGNEVLAKAQIVHSPRKGVVVKFTVRSDAVDVSAAVVRGVEL